MTPQKSVAIIFKYLVDNSFVQLWLQIRDLTVYIEAQKTLKDMTDSDGIKGGTILPIPSKQSSSTSSKRHAKTGRKRS